MASAIAPSAVLLTGDLTDSKTSAGIGLQQPDEWHVYRQAVLRLQDKLGLDSGQVLDCRGNHDAFSVPVRCRAHVKRSCILLADADAPSQLRASVPS